MTEYRWRLVRTRAHLFLEPSRRAAEGWALRMGISALPSRRPLEGIRQQMGRAGAHHHGGEMQGRVGL
jgi:hypothetical protein